MVRVLEVCMAQLLSGYHGQGVACEEKLFIFYIVLNLPK